jgi:iron complex transport system permease protein
MLLAVMMVMSMGVTNAFAADSGSEESNVPVISLGKSSQTSTKVNDVKDGESVAWVQKNYIKVSAMDGASEYYYYASLTAQESITAEKIKSEGQKIEPDTFAELEVKPGYSGGTIYLYAVAVKGNSFSEIAESTYVLNEVSITAKAPTTEYSVYNENVATIFDLRFPRIFIAMFGGAAMAVSGVLLQAVMKNPLADPGIIGISSGASLVAVLITAFFPALYFFTPLFAFLGGMIAFLLVYSLSWKGGLSPLRIILVGVAVNAMFTGLMSAFNSGTGSNYSGVASIVNANITMKTWDDLQTLLLYGVVGLIASFFVLGQCNLLALEDKTARSLGVNVNKSRIVISVIAVLLAGISTAVIGPISFLGLIVPHIARLLVGSNHKILVPYTILLGAFTLLLADTVGRTIAAPYEISASVIMSVVGGPFFIILLRRSRQNYGQ